MARKKKRQLTGKKTRLAKLVLTEVLSRQGQEPAPTEPPLPLPALPFQQLAFAWSVGQGQQGQIDFWPAAYLQIIRELEELHATLLSSECKSSFSSAALPPIPLPPPPKIRAALRQTRREIAALSQLLAQEE